MLFQILPKKKYQFNAEATLMLFKSLSHNTSRKGLFKQLLSPTAFAYQFIIECDQKAVLTFYIKVHGQGREESTLRTLQAWCANEADVFEALQPLAVYETVNTLYCNERTKEKESQRLATFNNPMIFNSILGVLTKNIRITIDFNVEKASSKQKSFQLRTSDVELETLIRVCGQTKYERNIVREVSHKVANLTAGDREFSIDYKDSWNTTHINGMELINLMQIPTLYRNEDTEFLKRIQYLRPGQMTLTNFEFADGIRIGTLYHPMQEERSVYVSETILRSHSIVTGTTGSGKTSAIEEQIEHILLRKAKGESNVPGFTFFDPAESSVLGVIDKILKLESDGYDVKSILDKTIYVDFKNEDYIFPISLINKDVDSNELISFLNSLFVDANAIQAERLMNSAVNSLLMDDEEHSIFDVERIFSDEKFRSKILDGLKGNMYAEREREFLESKFNPNMIAPILNRLDPFANNRIKKLMFGMTSEYDQTKNIRKWMDEGYIILFNIKGLNAFDIKTIVGYNALQYYRTALTRPDFSLMHNFIVDEAHKVQLPIFTKFTAELRKQGLSLNQMTQQMEQFNQDYLQKLIGNINTIISFRQNDDRAARNVKSFILSDMELNDFKTLPDMVGYVSTFDTYDNQKKSVLIKVNPPYRYTNGKLVNYKKEDEMSFNIEKNREFAKQLMKEKLILREDAEQIVFKRHFNEEAEAEYEKELLSTGDSLLSVEKGGGFKWEE